MKKETFLKELAYVLLCFSFKTEEYEIKQKLAKKVISFN